MKQDDPYKVLLKAICKAENISPRRIKFESTKDVVVFHVKNQLREGIDLKSFRIISLMPQIVNPLGIKFNQQLYLSSRGDRLDKVTITFEKQDYLLLNKKIKEGNIQVI